MSLDHIFWAINLKFFSLIMNPEYFYNLFSENHHVRISTKLFISQPVFVLYLNFAARVKVFVQRLKYSRQNLRSWQNKGNRVKSVQGEASSASINNNRKT